MMIFIKSPGKNVDLYRSAGRRLPLGKALRAALGTALPRGRISRTSGAPADIKAAGAGVSA